MDTLNQMDVSDRGNMLTYINDYCSEKLKFDDGTGCFEISCDEELKLLLYGIEERYYTTRFGNEKGWPTRYKNYELFYIKGCR